MSTTKPTLFVFAGPNGSGKSTVTESFSQNVDLYINADDITKEKANNLNLDINKIDKETLNNLNLSAAREADYMRSEAIKNKLSFATETVMSTPAKLELMREAKNNGYNVHLVYVTTQDSSINITRVNDRIDKGGHSVPPEKIALRYERAMKLLPEAIAISNSAHIFNNSFENPVKIFEKTKNNEIILYPQNPPNIKSQWTEQKLMDLKKEVAFFDSINSINTAKPLKDLKWSAPSDELYKAAAKEAMQQTGGSFKFDNLNNEHEPSTDKIVMQKLVDKGISPQRIKEVMKHSPQIEGKSPAEKEIKLQQFSKQLEKIPSLSRGLER